MRPHLTGRRMHRPAAGRVMARRRMRILPALVLVVCAAGLGCDQPLAPSPPSPPPESPNRPPGLVAASVSGEVIDADSGLPVAGAVVTIAHVRVVNGLGINVSSPDGAGTSAVADGSGAFRLEPRVRDDWVSVVLNVTRDGYEPIVEWSFTPTTPTSAAVLMVYPTLTLRPGGFLQTRMSPISYACGWESYRCRRVLVESAPGESVEVELVPPTGPDNGLEPDDEPFPFTGYKRRVTVSGGAVWIIGGTSPVTLTARRP